MHPSLEDAQEALRAFEALHGTTDTQWLRESLRHIVEAVDNLSSRLDALEEWQTDHRLNQEG
jgi:hypothetical protein